MAPVLQPEPDAELLLHYLRALYFPSSVFYGNNFIFTATTLWVLELWALNQFLNLSLNDDWLY